MTPVGRGVRGGLTGKGRPSLQLPQFPLAQLLRALLCGHTSNTIVIEEDESFSNHSWPSSSWRKVGWWGCSELTKTIAIFGAMIFGQLNRIR